MSTGTTDPVLERGARDPARRQAEALEVSGWGERFVFVQPHNLCFWVFVVLTAIGAFQTWAYYDPEVGFYAEGFALAAVLCGLCGLAWWAWFRHIDRWERQPGDLVLAALVWGAIPATFAFAMTANTAMLGIYPKLFGQDWAAAWAAGATAPITEEAAKLCGFLLLMGLAPRLVRTANDGLVIGAFIGLGFAVFEDFLYSANATSHRLRHRPGRQRRADVVHPDRRQLRLASAVQCAGLQRGHLPDRHRRPAPPGRPRHRLRPGRHVPALHLG